MHDASAPARDVVWNAGHRKGSAVVELDEATLKRVALVVPRKEVSPRDLPPLAALSSDPPADAVVGKDMRRYHSTSLFCLKVHHPFRRTAIRIVESPPFDPIILITIICNCATMGWESPLDPEGTPKAHFIAVCEWVYLIIFTFELLSKVVAYGFAMHSDSYLRDAWCQLDFTVVTLAWIPILFPSFGNYSVIRSVRALRPLRALKRVPGMPMLVNSVMSAVPKLGNVVGLLFFIFLVFGIVGMELFKGALHYRCALPGFVESSDHPTGSSPLARRNYSSTSPVQVCY